MDKGKFNTLLTETGLILGAATVVGIIAPLMDISTRDSAVLSVSTILLVSLCHYRQAIDQNISSALSLAVLVICALVYYFSYENIILKDTGLISFSKKSNDYLGEISRLIADSKREMILFGTDFHITVEDKREQLLKKLGEGVDVKFLILNPYSTRLEMVAADFDVNPEKLRSESIDGIQGLLTLVKRWSDIKAQSQNPGVLDVRLFDSAPKMRAYFFDGGSSGGRAYLVPYMNKLNSPQIPGYLFEVKKDGIAEIYLSGIRKLWQEAMPLETIVAMLNTK